MKGFMNLSEIINSLPNGFHDSGLEELTQDFNENSIKLTLSVWLDDSAINGVFEGKRRQGYLSLKKIRYFIHEPVLFMNNTNEKELLGAAWISIGCDYSKVEKPKIYIDSENSGWIFFKQYNGFIHFNAEEIEFYWNK